MARDPTAATLQQLVSVIRAQLEPSAFDSAPDLVRALAHDALDAGDAQALAHDQISSAIQQTAGRPGQALRLLAGLDRTDPVYDGARAPGREALKNAAGRILKPQPDGGGLTARRVEQLEVQYLAPLVAAHLGLIEPVPIPRGLREDVVHRKGPVEPSSIANRTRPVFVQYCNPELMYLSGLGSLMTRPDVLLPLMRGATRLALLLTDNLLLFPASYLYEVPGFADLVDEAGPVRDEGLFAYIAPTADLRSFEEQKSVEYRDDLANPYIRHSGSGQTGLIWRPRAGKPTAQAITERWVADLNAGDGDLTNVAAAIARRTNRRDDLIVGALSRIPDRLDGRAFIGRFAQEVSDVTFTSQELAELNAFLSSTYLRSYLGDMDATILVDLPFGDLALDLRSSALSHQIVSVRPLLTALGRLGIDRFLLDQATWDEFMRVRALPETAFVFDELLTHVGSRRTEMAMGKSRHPSKVPRNVGMAISTIGEFHDLLAKTAER